MAPFEVQGSKFNVESEQDTERFSHFWSVIPAWIAGIQVIWM